MRKFIIKSRPTDISEARSNPEKNCGTCPLAIAMRRATGVLWKVSRSGAWSKEYGRVSFGMDVTRWIDKYDAHELMKPIEFTIAV